MAASWVPTPAIALMMEAANTSTGLNGARIQKIAAFILGAVRT
jgi:hypothetical protein